MKVDYINAEMTESVARVTFVGYDSPSQKRRRPLIELDASDLARLVEVAKDFRDHQKRRAQMHNERGDAITQAGVSLS